MSFNRSRRAGTNFGAGNGYGRQINPWDANNSFRNTDALALANNLISNLLRNQTATPPSLIDMAARNRGYGGSYDYDDRMVNRNMVSHRNNIRRARDMRKLDSKNRPKNILVKSTISNSNTKFEADSTDNYKKTDQSNMKEKKTEDRNKSEERKCASSLYSNIPNDMFYCHLCTKHMWDALSFENHLKGRTHQMMKEGIEESYSLKANMIRQEAKIAEQLKSIEIDRLKRLGKQIRASNQHREYCIMCDLHFYGHLSTHRKSDGHLTLKKFLHPKCNDCNTEFHNRSEYDEHLLSPCHLRNSKTKPTSKSEERKRNQLHILKEIDEIQGLREVKKLKEKKKGMDQEKSIEETEAIETDELEKDDGEDELHPAEESGDVILDFIDGVSEIDADIETRLPKYNSNRPVGFSMIHKLECFECRLCTKYMDTEKTAEIHSRTMSHHRNFLKFLNEKANETKIAQKRAAAVLEDNERKRVKLEEFSKKGNDKNLYNPSEITGDEENNGNKNDVDDEENTEEKPVIKEDTVSKESKVIIKESDENQDHLTRRRGRAKF
ncbi:zinc finger protein on ecdysone puffs isoform X2 [Culicoides brevitarsis]|uniref:zinc finger protein on ecdysone puffs isoform X2 n=1 Tax=Culicoides brevitarsis TaxID=469753 RepID=UPI00307C8095